MPIEVAAMVRALQPERTVLMFGAGASTPSGAPSRERLQTHFERQFGIQAAGYTLAEQSSLVEQLVKDRHILIESLRSEFTKLVPTGSILNLPLYSWKSIFTTNFDELIEASYTRRNRSFSVCASNFDFSIRADPDAVQIFKLHGTISKDISDGNQSRIILTESDYDNTQEYREFLYDRLRADLSGATLVIIGQSLADPDIKDVVNRALSLNAKIGAAGRIVLFSYTRDEGRASLLESRGLTVAFGGIDDFFAGLADRVVPTGLAGAASPDPLDVNESLRPATLDARPASNSRNADVSAMYNGWPATYADIAANLTFRRNVADEIEANLLASSATVAVLLGASGVGKTTAARQVVTALLAKNWFGWEHRPDQPLLHAKWRRVARQLTEEGNFGVLFVDDAHAELGEINDLVDALTSDGNRGLKVILASTGHQWRPRVKTPAIYRHGKEYQLSRVADDEIDRLLVLIDTNDELRPLVDAHFRGFSRPEKRRRLAGRCEADMFVCLKNIFSSEKFDDIILREYAELAEGSREVYRSVAAMESSGVRVHRQLIIRLLNIPAMEVGAVLVGLTDIVSEYTVNEREGIYGWRGRHRVIMSIISQHKYFDTEKRIDLLEKVIAAISPTYDIEIRTIRELCNVEDGVASIPSLEKQNGLLRKMMSVAPGERVPRHRLIRNLISLGQFDSAETEIRLFQNDFGLDGPAVRYRINLATARAVRSPGLLAEDRAVLIEKAREIAAAGASRFRMNKAILIAYCEVGVETAKLTGRSEVFDTAIAELKDAEDRIGDPDISRAIARLDRRMEALDLEASDEVDLDLSIE